jgi:polyphosphate kinase 2 (PPK2 family)
VFEILKLKHKIGKADYKAQEPQLRGDLIDVQFDLLESGEFPVVVLLGGMDIPGRSEMAKQLMSWMDPRHIRPFAMFRPSAEEQERPRMWRFWRALPRSGRIGVFLNSWYEGPALDYFLGHIDQASFRARIEEIVRFERMLALEGVLLLKFMFIVDEKQNIKDIERLRKDHSVAWKVAEEELELGKQFAERYDTRARQAIRRALRQRGQGDRGAGQRDQYQLCAMDRATQRRYALSRFNHRPHHRRSSARPPG